MKHLFFDLDNTLTPSRGLVKAPMVFALDALRKAGYDIVIVSGARFVQAYGQMRSMPAIYLSQNGNQAIEARSFGNQNDKLWEDILPVHPAEIFRHIFNSHRVYYGNTLKNIGGKIENRGSQISYSFIGHEAPMAKKRKFDPTASVRKEILKANPFVSKKYEVKIGGTTCFDYFKIGHHKGFNVAKLVSNKRWKAADCVYVGDALFKGGNDESVIGVLKVKKVRNPDDTLKYIRAILNKKGGL